MAEVVKMGSIQSDVKALTNAVEKLKEVYGLMWEARGLRNECRRLLNEVVVDVAKLTGLGPSNLSHPYRFYHYERDVEGEEGEGATVWRLEIDPYPHFEEWGRLERVEVTMSVYGKEDSCKIRVRVREGDRCKEVDYELDRLKLKDLCELAYNCDAILGLLESGLRERLSQLSKTLDLIKSLVAQLRMLGLTKD
jgi:hypothetical protein